MTNWLKSLGTFLLGFGTFMIGVVSIIAVFKTGTVLDEILKIQDQAKQIKFAVNNLGKIIKEQELKGAVSELPSFKKKDKAGIKKIMKKFSKDKSLSGVFLPLNKLDSTVDNLYQAETTEEREEILRGVLMYRSTE